MVGNIQRIVIHPRKLNNSIKRFLEQANSLTYTETIRTPQTYETLVNRPKSNEDNLDEWFADLLKTYKDIEMPCAIRITKDSSNCAYIEDFLNKDETVIHIGYDIRLYTSPLQYLPDFTDNFRKRCPLAKGFANITLIMLHELGHFYVALDDSIKFSSRQRFAQLQYIAMFIPKGKQNEEYFKMPDEHGATEWAIKWLQDPEHRKIAKRFEKEFFSCFQKV